MSEIRTEASVPTAASSSNNRGGGPSNGAPRKEPQQKTIPLGLHKNYVPGWSPCEAFRELYQNWKDAILVMFELDHRDFIPERQDLENEIRISVFHPRLDDSLTGQRKLLGYILYKKGSVELANFEAHLTENHLRLGGTTKLGNDRVAGIHGEGLKIASLVLVRNGYRVRVTSNSFNWHFVFPKANLCCQKKPYPDQKLKDEKSQYEKQLYQGNLRDLKANAWEDVSVLVGNGQGNLNKKVSEADFKEWMKVSLDLTGPQEQTDIIQTDDGDLILDPSFKDKVCLKGLFLPLAGSAANRYEFGYNFLRGRTNRDRQRLRNPEYEATALMKIWHDAIVVRGVEILDKFIDLLQNHHTAADVNMAESKVLEDTAKDIWRRLLQCGVDKFYYCENHGDLDCDIIRNSLKLQPAPLSKKLWGIIRRFSLCRTPQEQQIYLFENSERSTLQPSVFLVNIKRGLKASLAMDPISRDVIVEYVKGVDTDIDILFGQERCLKVNEKYLCFDTAHETARCVVSRQDGQLTNHLEDFSCDHIIEDLYGLALSEITRAKSLDQGKANSLARSLRLEVTDSLRQMPRMVSISCTERPFELAVTWNDRESEIFRERYGASIIYCVVLRREATCSEKKTQYLYQHGPLVVDNDAVMTDSVVAEEVYEALAPCGCRQAKTSQIERKAVFSGLSIEPYFPMVFREASQSFIGLPPAPIIPVSQSSNPDSNHLLCDIPHNGAASSYIYSDDDSPPNGPSASQASDRPLLSSLPIAAPQGANATSSTIDSIPTLREIEQVVQLNDDHSRTQDRWEEEGFPAAFNRLFRPRVLSISSQLMPTILQANSSLPPISRLYVPHLSSTLMRDEYIKTQLKPSNGERNKTEYILFIYDIVHVQRSEGHPRLSLIVTRYSVPRTAFPFYSNDSLSFDRKEVFLHFRNFSIMGQRHDAEIIFVDDILQVGKSDPVQHVNRVPEDPHVHGYFCRFAIRSQVADESACLTPIGSHLLPPEDHWRLPRYAPLSKPFVTDLCPQSLGLSQGFRTEGCEIGAGLGFDSVIDMSWKVRHPSAVVYDDTSTSALSQMASGQLVSLQSMGGPGVPQVLLVAGFDVNIIQAVLKQPSHDNSRPFDFLMWVVPVTTLHQQNLCHFAQIVLQILKRRYSVHFHKVHLPSHGLPEEKTYLVIVASPVCSAFPLAWGEHTQKTVNEIIGDLSFENPRSKPTETGSGSRARTGGFICLKPPDNTETIYNHNTGEAPLPDARTVEFDTISLKPSPFFLNGSRHSSRGDQLTVRECARIHGFPDDYIFYGRDEDLRRQLLLSFPPPLARVIARGVKDVIEEYREMEFTSGPRGNKRPRVAE